MAVIEPISDTNPNSAVDGAPVDLVRAQGFHRVEPQGAVRGHAQGLFNLMILGFGPLVANVLGPRLIGETFNRAGVVDFRSLFLVPCAAALFAAVVLALFFHPPQQAQTRVVADAVPTRS